MRRLPFIALSLILAAVVAPQALHAAGNVLVPSDSSASGSDSATLPNLGLSAPTQSNSAPTTTQPPIVSPQTPTSTTSQVQTPAAALPSFAQTPITTGSPQMPAPIAPFTAEELKSLPPGSLPTRVLQQPDMSAALAKAQASQNLPYSLAISFSGKSYFGAKDVATITNKLGLSHDQVANSCYLSLRGFAQTDKGGGVMFGGGLSPQVTVRYSGAIKSYMMMAIALCTAGPNLPKGSGFLTEIVDRFAISLQPIKCDPPTRQATSLTITYDGSDKSQCVYQ
jgi:hypothetical protein